MAKILLVDDEPSILGVLGTLLKAEGHDVSPALGGERALDLIKSGQFDLMLCDIRMAPIDGMEVLKHARQSQPLMAVIMLTAYGSLETAIGAMKFGAFDYITKPFKVDELMITVQRALDYIRTVSENASLKAKLQTQYRIESIIAESPSMQAVCELVKKVAPTDATVLIYGESGTGKELVAKAIHACSRRHDKSFLPVNCAALPEPLLESEMFGHVKGAFTGATANKEGLFEAASGGTIFLDEIGSMPMSIQAKLLRTLQEKEIRRVGSNETIPIDARVLAATNTRLESLMKAGTFREDLYYRLNVIPIEVEPLKKRREDIIPLFYHFLRRETPEGQNPPAVSQEVQAILESYDWPGNVRELENAVKHALALARENALTRDALPSKILATQPSGPLSRPVQGPEDLRGKSLKAFLREREKEYLQHVLSSVGGNKEDAAKALRISLATLYRKLPEQKD